MLRLRRGTGSMMTWATKCDARTDAGPVLAARSGSSELQSGCGADDGGLQKQRRRRGTGPVLTWVAKCEAGTEARFASSARVGRRRV